ncbi:TetR/AcrR family transcriptional regulator [Blastococcus sp. SYSU D00820]
MATAPRRPAHRPSRRQAVLDAAMHLYAVRRFEDVTVADIATEAGMTSAAVYYHYPSKDDLLLEGLRAFAGGMLEELRRLLDDAAERGSTEGEVIADLVAWMDGHRYAAVVWFVASPGLSESVERIRRETRLEMVEVFAALFRERGSDMSRADATVAGAGLVVLLEQSAVSSLTEDVVLANLGRRRFLAEVAELGNLIAGRTAAEPAG